MYNYNKVEALQRYRVREGLIVIENCTNEENAAFANESLYPTLPDGVYQHMQGNFPIYGFYRIKKSGLTKKEANEYLQHRQIQMQKEQAEVLGKINSKLTFFVVLAIIGISLAFIALVGTCATAFTATRSSWLW